MITGQAPFTASITKEARGFQLHFWTNLPWVTLKHAGSQLSRRAMTPHWKVLTRFWGLIIAERDHTQAQVVLRRWVLDAQHHRLVETTLASQQPCSQSLEDAPHFDTQELRLREESFTQPPSWFALDLASGERTLKPAVPVYGG